MKTSPEKRWSSLRAERRSVGASERRSVYSIHAVGSLGKASRKPSLAFLVPKSGQVHGAWARGNQRPHHPQTHPKHLRQARRRNPHRRRPHRHRGRPRRDSRGIRPMSALPPTLSPNVGARRRTMEEAGAAARGQSARFQNRNHTKPKTPTMKRIT